MLDKGGGQTGPKVIKTWLNSWATLHRLCEDLMLECILGCKDAPYSMTHYVCCPHLFAFQRFVFDGISDDPPISFAFEFPEFFFFKVL